MRRTTDSRPGRLPKSFPIGSTYVVEGRSSGNGTLRVSSRYVLMPNGYRIDVPVRRDPPRTIPNLAAARRGKTHARPRPRKAGNDIFAATKKIAMAAGTKRRGSR